MGTVLTTQFGQLVAKRRRVGKKFIKNIYNDLRTKHFFWLSFRIFFMSYPKDFVLRSILLFFLFILKKYLFFFQNIFGIIIFMIIIIIFPKKKFLAYKRSLAIWEKYSFCKNNFLSL